MRLMISQQDGELAPGEPVFEVWRKGLFLARILVVVHTVVVAAAVAAVVAVV